MDKSDQNYQDYRSYTNSWWLIVVTMSTVGYGDYFPRTHLGRFISVLACFFGVFLVSSTVYTLTKSSEIYKGTNRCLKYRILIS
jgi:hypothetical protein